MQPEARIYLRACESALRLLAVPGVVKLSQHPITSGELFQQIAFELILIRSVHLVVEPTLSASLSRYV